MKYSEKNPPIQCFMRNSKWYKQSGTFTPRGLLWHDTGVDNPWIKRYVQPDDNDPNRDELLKIIGKNTNGNDWNHGNKDKDAGLNCWVGKLQDGTVATVQAGPWTKRPWGCGGGRFGSLNDTHIQWEICEDDKTDVKYAGEAYEESLQISAYLCKMFNIDPHATFQYKGYTIPTIVCHWDSFLIGWNGIPIYKKGSKGGFGSGHTDIYDWNALYDYLGLSMKQIYGDPYKINPLDNPVMNRVRDDIAKILEPTPAHKDGWCKVDGKWYFYEDGQMLKSHWVKYKGESYYMGSDGAMVTGWQKIGDDTYYFYSDGRMARGEWIDGLYLNQDGTQTYKYKGVWKKDSKGSWYEDESGWYPKSRDVRIDGKDYHFNAEGYLES